MAAYYLLPNGQWRAWRATGKQANGAALMAQRFALYRAYRAAMA